LAAPRRASPSRTSHLILPSPLSPLRAGSWAPAPEAELRTIAGLLATTPSLSTLAAAAAAAGLVSALDSPAARLTVFAPTNDALDQLLAATGVTAQELLSDPAVLRALLSNHVVPGVARAADLYDGQVLTTLLGGKVQVIPATISSLSPHHHHHHRHHHTHTPQTLASQLSNAPRAAQRSQLRLRRALTPCPHPATFVSLRRRRSRAALSPW
jgi:hypothetical protein